MKCKNQIHLFNENNLTNDFTQSDDQNAGLGSWSIVNSVIFNRNVLVNQKKKEGTPMHSKMIFEQSECVNGKYSLNVWFKEELVNKAFIAFIFRYLKIGLEEAYY